MNSENMWFTQFLSQTVKSWSVLVVSDLYLRFKVCITVRLYKPVLYELYSTLKMHFLDNVTPWRQTEHSV